MSNAQKIPLVQSLTKFAQKEINNAYQQFGKALPCSVVSVNGSIVTVKFEVISDFTLPNVTIPHFGPEYVRYPTQVGDKGFVIPADARLGGVSGLGGGTANLSENGNLSTLVFFPIANTAWSSVNPDAVTIYGPDGVVLRDTGSETTLVLTPNGVIVSGQNEVILVTGNSQVTVNATETQISSNGCSVTVTSSGVAILGNTAIVGAFSISGVPSGQNVSITNGSSSITMTSSGIDLSGTITFNGQPYLSHHHSGVTTGGGNTGGVV